MPAPRPRRVRPPLDAEALDRLALHYLGRYATSRAKLRTYLDRKLRESGWAGEGPPPLDALVERMAGLGYVDDRLFAEAKAGSLARRGYGARRQHQALRAAGIAGEDLDAVQDEAAARLEAALAFARRRRIGPYGDAPLDPDQRRRQFAAMIRAGHAPRDAALILDAEPGHVPELDG